METEATKPRVEFCGACGKVKWPDHVCPPEYFCAQVDDVGILAKNLLSQTYQMGHTSLIPAEVEALRHALTKDAWVSVKADSERQAAKRFLELHLYESCEDFNDRTYQVLVLSRTGLYEIKIRVEIAPTFHPEPEVKMSLPPAIEGFLLAEKFL